MTSVTLGGRVVAADGTLPGGFVEIESGRITRLSADRPPSSAAADASWTIVPGFVDIHVHGGGGYTMTAGDPDAVEGAASFHRRHGTTTTMASLVTAPADDLVSAIGRIAGFLEEASPGTRPAATGIHLEGPFLATARCGAQNPAHMVDPDPTLVAELIEAGRGHVRMVTIAPERPGALAAIRQFTEAGVIAAVGHTDATFEQASAAIAAGATVATHLGNAMPPLHHREPGPIGACLAAPGVVCELIVDGHHLHPAMVVMASSSKGEDGIALITDAISATGVGDGRYVLGTLDVDVVDGVARLVEGGSLAGSTLTMDVAFHNAVECGLPLGAASRAASLNPARVLGLEGDVGSIEVGKRADLVVLDEDMSVVAVVVDGVVVEGEL
jgi:N-acetylglucosamine-6-phosphate deacetylase